MELLGSLNNVKNECLIKLDFDDDSVAKLTFKALSPEASSALFERVKVFLSLEGCSLLVELSASDTVALRAAINSWLRWISTLEKVYNLFVKNKT